MQARFAKTRKGRRWLFRHQGFFRADAVAGLKVLPLLAAALPARACGSFGLSGRYGLLHDGSESQGDYDAYAAHLESDYDHDQ
jgi:hypothetical protein